MFPREFPKHIVHNILIVIYTSVMLVASKGLLPNGVVVK